MEYMNKVIHVKNVGNLREEQSMKNFFAQEVREPEYVQFWNGPCCNEKHAFITFKWADDVAIILKDKRNLLEGLARLHAGAGFKFERPDQSVWEFYKVPDQSGNHAMGVNPPPAPPPSAFVQPFPGPPSATQQDSIQPVKALTVRASRNAQHRPSAKLPPIGTTEPGPRTAKPALPSPQTPTNFNGQMQQAGIISPLEHSSASNISFSLASRETVSTPDTPASNIPTPPSTPPGAPRGLPAAQAIPTSGARTPKSKDQDLIAKLAESHKRQRIVLESERKTWNNERRALNQDKQELCNRIAALEAGGQDRKHPTPALCSPSNPLKRPRNMVDEGPHPYAVIEETGVDRARRRRLGRADVPTEADQQVEFDAENTALLQQHDDRLQNHEAKGQSLTLQMQAMSSEHAIRLNNLVQALDDERQKSAEVGMERDTARTQRDDVQSRLVTSEVLREDLGFQLAEAHRARTILEIQAEEMTHKVQKLELQVSESGLTTHDLESKLRDLDRDHDILLDEFDALKTTATITSARLKQEKETNDTVAQSLVAAEARLSDLQNELSESRQANSIREIAQAQRDEAASSAFNELLARFNELRTLHDQLARDHSLLATELGGVRLARGQAEEKAATEYSKACQAESKYADAQANATDMVNRVFQEFTMRKAAERAAERELARATFAGTRATNAENLLKEVRNSRDSLEVRVSEMTTTMTAIREQLARLNTTNTLLQQQLQREKSEKEEALKAKDHALRHVQGIR